MLRFLGILITMVIGLTAEAQTTINFQENAENRLYIRLYAHVDYNQKLESGIRHAGKMDVHRVVTLFGYQFGRNTQFVSEIEVEHVKEIFVEQAFVKHRLTKGISVRAGLMLVPMGFVNEMHEPTFFYSVERPLLDKVIIPTTWREIGVGISGLINDLDLKYQLYLFNNPLGYDNGAKVGGRSGFRNARQKGAESVVSTLPGLSGQIEYYGIDNFKLGLSAYHGKTNTTLINDFPEITSETQEFIDSSTVTMTMATVHSSLNVSQWTLRGQYTLATYANTQAYNAFGDTDVPEMMHGLYLVAAYDFLKDQNVNLEPFFRFSHLNNHLRVNDNLEENNAFSQNIYTMGVNYKPHPGVVFKIDYQFFNKGDNSNFRQVNAGIGVWF